MRNWVNQWFQDGRLYVWRYAEPGKGWDGWHFTADPTGCRSVRNLLDRMQGGQSCYRTLRLERVSEDVLSVPNCGHKIDGHFEKLCINYDPAFAALDMRPNGAMLVITIGDRRLRRLAAAFARVEVGEGDFGINTSDEKRAPGWMFWWMLDIDYRNGKRL